MHSAERRYKRWNQVEEERLINLYKMKLSPSEIGEALERTTKAVVIRLELLGYLEVWKPKKGRAGTYLEGEHGWRKYNCEIVPESVRLARIKNDIKKSEKLCKKKN